MSKNQKNIARVYDWFCVMLLIFSLAFSIYAILSNSDVISDTIRAAILMMGGRIK